MGDLFREIFESIRRNRLRTCLTGLAVSWGIFMLIVLLGAGNGVMNALNRNMEGMPSNTMEIYPGITSKPYAGYQQGRWMSMDESDVEITRSRSFAENVDEVIPVLTKSDFTMVYGKMHTSVRLSGITHGYCDIYRINMDAGRFLNRLDDEERRKVVVITHNQAKLLMNGSTDYKRMIGERVEIGGLSFKVIGVRHGWENENDNGVYLPYGTMKMLYAKSTHIDELNFTFHDLETEEANEEFEKRYRAALNSAHDAAPDDESSFWIHNRFVQNLKANKGRNILEISLWVLGIFTLLGGIVGVSNIMLITVKERTHEFGIRKAIGASPFQITKLIISESVVITALFGYLGMILGLAACELMNVSSSSSSMEMFGEKVQILLNPTVSVATAAEVTLVLIIAGTIAGLLPARKAAKVRPIEALNGK